MRGIRRPVGSKTILKDGYVIIKTEKPHPTARKCMPFWPFEHRKVWLDAHPEDLEALLAGATVHHKNGNRSDNRVENLDLRLLGKHREGWRLEDISTEKLLIELKDRGVMAEILTKYLILHGSISRKQEFINFLNMMSENI